MKYLLKYFKGYKKHALIAPIFKLFESATEIINPLLVANMIDVGIANHDAKYIAIIGSIVVVLNFIGIVCALVCQRLASKATSGFAYNLRKDLYSHINKLSFAELDKFGVSTLNNRITHDVTRIRQAFATFIRQVMRTPFLLIGATIMAMIIDLKLSLIFLVVAPLTIGAVFIILKITDPLYQKAQKNLDKVSQITRENLQGVRVVRAFNKEDFEAKRFEDASTELCQTSVKVANTSSLLIPISTTIINFAIIAVLWFGGIQVNVGGLSQGQIIAFVNYMTQISAALVSLANIIISFIKAINCSHRVKEVFDTSPSVIETNKEPLVLSSNIIAPKIEFKNVTFSYNGSPKPAIKNLNLVVEPGETIGIIGGTGSGKSSIVNLIPRFYDATEGEVFVDGVNVRDYSFKQLRDKIGIVPQKAVLFKGSLKENMRWRKHDATIEEIRKAIQVSQSEEFVNELPEKYDSRVQSGGKNFSGGQRQRLTIARALVGEPEILVLDDSASALDFATDAALRKAIKEQVHSTVIIVSQRAGTVKNANKIVVLDNGDVVGIGKHKELLESCPVYKEIYESQTK